jgi:hypothetical protein
MCANPATSRPRKAAGFLFLATELLLSGCASPYLQARRADARDIVTASVSDTALGGKVRVGPVSTGLYAGMGDEGWRGGAHVLRWDQKRPTSGDICLLLWGHEYLDAPQLTRPGKAFTTDAVLPFVQWPRPPNLEGKFPLAHLTQIELNIALGLGLRLGINPGELADFLLGWLTVDLLGDDVEPSPPGL